MFNWSGGKDSALALSTVLRKREFDVVSLFTMIDEGTLKSSVHSIPVEIIARQAESIGIPLYTKGFAADFKDYDKRMREVGGFFKSRGVTHFIFGDILLSNARVLRKRLFNPMGIEVVEPLWNKTSEEVMDIYLKSGIKSKVVVVQADKLDKASVGADLNVDFIKTLPHGVDCCGEYGEYHSLSYGGYPFRKEVSCSLGETCKVARDIRLSDGQTRTFEYWKACIV